MLGPPSLPSQTSWSTIAARCAVRKSPFAAMRLAVLLCGLAAAGLAAGKTMTPNQVRASQAQGGRPPLLNGDKTGAHYDYNTQREAEHRVLTAGTLKVPLAYRKKVDLNAVPKDMEAWDYSQFGTHGPDYWGRYSTVCSKGTMQSPVDLSTTFGRPLPGGVRPMKLSYKQSQMVLSNDGKAISAKFKSMANMMTAQGNEYSLENMELHSPSEHTVNGVKSDLEVQLYHTGQDGRLAVVAVLFNIAEESNDFINALWQVLPRGKGAKGVVAADPNLLMPSGSLFSRKGGNSYYTYEGSLTSPPCDEGVTWYVLKDQGTVTAQQIEVMRIVLQSAKVTKNFLNMEKDALATSGQTTVDPNRANARPVQPLNGRRVYFDNIEAAKPFYTLVEPSKLSIKLQKAAMKSDVKVEVHSEVANLMKASNEKVRRMAKALKLAMAENKSLKRKMVSEKKALQKKMAEAKKAGIMKGEKMERVKDKGELKKAASALKGAEKVMAKGKKQLNAVPPGKGGKTSAKKKDDKKKDKKLMKAAEIAAGGKKTTNKNKANEESEVARDLMEANEFGKQTVKGQLIFPEEDAEPASGYVKLHKMDAGATSGSYKLALIENNSFKIEGVEPGKYLAESVVRGYESQHSPVYVKGDDDSPTLAIQMSRQVAGGTSQ